MNLSVRDEIVAHPSFTCCGSSEAEIVEFIVGPLFPELVQEFALAFQNEEISQHWPYFLGRTVLSVATANATSLETESQLLGALVEVWCDYVHNGAYGIISFEDMRIFEALNDQIDLEASGAEAKSSSSPILTALAKRIDKTRVGEPSTLDTTTRTIPPIEVAPDLLSDLLSESSHTGVVDRPLYTYIIVDLLESEDFPDEILGNIPGVQDYFKLREDLKNCVISPDDAKTVFKAALQSQRDFFDAIQLRLFDDDELDGKFAPTAVVPPAPPGFEDTDTTDE